MKRGIVVRTVINGLVFDGATKEPMQMAVRDALISFMAALSQAQAEATKEAQRAGIEHAKARDDAYRGRKPSFTRKQLDQVRDMLRIGTSISTIAKTAGLSRQAIYRLKDNPAWAEGVDGRHQERYAIFAGFAQFEREMMLERQREGIARRRLRIATRGGGRRSRRAPCRRQAAFYRPQGTPSTSHSSSPNETVTTGTFETTKPRTGSSYGSTSATRASPRASCFWVYAYPAFLRYAAHSAGGYWARISPQASEMAW